MTLASAELALLMVWEEDAAAEVSSLAIAREAAGGMVELANKANIKRRRVILSALKE